MFDAYDKSVFVTCFNKVSKEVFTIALEKGWWDTGRKGPEIIATIHSEVSEAFEALREGNPKSIKAEGFSKLEEELADVIIRIMDWSVLGDLKVAEALLSKMKYNSTRSYRHGNKEY